MPGRVSEPSQAHLSLPAYTLTLSLLNSIWSSRSQQTFSIEGQIVTILGISGQMVSVAAVQLDPHIAEAAIDNVETNEHVCVQVKCHDGQ